jgi:hypothetical protein
LPSVAPTPVTYGEAAGHLLEKCALAPAPCPTRPVGQTAARRGNLTGGAALKAYRTRALVPRGAAVARGKEQADPTQADLRPPPRLGRGTHAPA